MRVASSRVPLASRTLLIFVPCLCTASLCHVRGHAYARVLCPCAMTMRHIHVPCLCAVSVRPCATIPRYGLTLRLSVTAVRMRYGLSLRPCGRPFAGVLVPSCQLDWARVSPTTYAPALDSCSPLCPKSSSRLDRVPHTHQTACYFGRFVSGVRVTPCIERWTRSDTWRVRRRLSRPGFVTSIDQEGGSCCFVPRSP